MMDELESAMATTEFLRSSPQIQVGFTQRWEQHRMYMMQEAAAQQQAMLATSANSAIAQATQQAAAMAAAGTVDASMSQLTAQKAQPTDSIVRAELKGGQSAPRKQAPPRG
jgi:pyruvate/oxaloacetate carboxyltransferase